MDQPQRDRRTDDPDARQRQIMADSWREWMAQPAPQARLTPATPSRIDWWRVLALLIVFGAAALTFVGGYLALVYVLTFPW
jgi:hypothetical protein